MLAALPTESHAPGIPRKPTVLFCWLSKKNGTLTGREGLEIAFHTCRIDEKMPAGAPKREEAVGMGDQTAAGAALKCLGSVPPGSGGRVVIHDYKSWFTVHGLLKKSLRAGSSRTLRYKAPSESNEHSYPGASLRGRL
jgi:hypothetical protein